MSGRKRSLLLLAFAGSVGCTDDVVEGVGRPVPMTIAVDPLEFLGGTPCADAQGAMRSYVATVTDLETGFVLASSPPVTCTLPVGFEYVIEGHAYSAEVDGYEQAAADLVPFGGVFSGSRTMLGDDGEPVSPRWSTSCGEGSEGAAIAQLATIVTVRGCEPLTDASPSDRTAITVDVEAAVGPLGCAGDGDGVVDSITVTPGDPALPPVTLGCGGVPVTYQSGVVAGQAYEFELRASAPDATAPSWGSRCFAVAKAGLEVQALCDPLTDSGSIAIDPLPLWAAAGLTCPGDIAQYSLALSSDGAAVELPARPCGQTALLTPVPAGDYGGLLTAVDAEGAEVVTAACGAVVPPGGEAQLLCTVVP